METGKKLYDYVYLEDYKHNKIFKDYKEKPVLSNSRESFSKINKDYLGKSHPKFYRF
jgi:hypothetical protein